MEGSGSNVGIERVATEQVIEGEATRNVLEKQLIRWAKRGDTTPSVINVERLQFRNTVPVTVVAFDDGKPGQQINVLGDGQTTVNHNAKILRAGGASSLLTAGAVHTFTMWEDRVWHESVSAGGGGGGGGGVTSFNGRAGAVVPLAADYTPAFIGAVPSTHLTDPDPHTQYVLDSEKGAAGGVAQLDGSSLVPKAQLGTGVADATKFLRGDGTWTPVGGGSGTYVCYDHELSPAAPSALDDEFNNAVLDAKWTPVNWIGPWTYDIDTTVPGSVHVRPVSTAPINTLRCLVQPIPAGDFVIVTHVELDGLPVNYSYAGLVMTTVTTGSSGSHLFHGLVIEGNSFARYTQTGAAFVGMSGTLNADGNSYEQEMVLRIRRVGANYFFGYSKNGRAWHERQLAPGFVPAFFGIGCLINGPASYEASFQYFRYNAVATTKFGGRQLRTKN